MMHCSLMRSGTAVAKRTAPRPASGVRHFRKSAPTKYTENKELTGIAGIVEADNHVWSVKLQHLTSAALMVSIPVAIAVSPSPLTLPVDLALGVFLPVHAHIGMNNVISDYVPKGNLNTLARLGWLGATSLMFLGLLRVNLEGPGITECVKTVWRESPNKTTSQ